MILTQDEREFLAAWAQEEWEPACYQLPAHRLQLAHGISAASLSALIRAWADAHGKKDYEILDAATGSDPSWPWVSQEEFRTRLNEAVSNRTPKTSSV
jgi:hypothetical protein